MEYLKSPWEEKQHLKDAVYSLRVAGQRWQYRRMKHDWIIRRGGEIEQLREATYIAALSATVRKWQSLIEKGRKIEINP